MKAFVQQAIGIQATAAEADAHMKTALHDFVHSNSEDVLQEHVMQMTANQRRTLTLAISVAKLSCPSCAQEQEACLHAFWSWSGFNVVISSA